MHYLYSLLPLQTHKKRKKPSFTDDGCICDIFSIFDCKYTALLEERLFLTTPTNPNMFLPYNQKYILSCTKIFC